MNVLILAGSRGPDDALAVAAGVRHKTLLPIGGVPMLWRVLRTLHEHPSVERIYVSIEDPAALAGIPDLAPLLSSGRVRRLETAASPAASLALAVSAIGLAGPLLITTGDHPLLSHAMIDALLKGAPADCDLAVGVAPGDIVAARYPGAIRTFYRLAGRRYSGCNLFLARSIHAIKIAEFWRRMEAFRKRPLRLLWEVGPIAMARVLLGLVDLDGACALLSKKTGARISAVLLPFAEAAIDVDKPDDWRLVEAIFAARGNKD